MEDEVKKWLRKKLEDTSKKENETKAAVPSQLPKLPQKLVKEPEEPVKEMKPEIKQMQRQTQYPVQQYPSKYSTYSTPIKYSYPSQNITSKLPSQPAEITKPQITKPETTLPSTPIRQNEIQPEIKKPESRRFEVNKMLVGIVVVLGIVAVAGYSLFLFFPQILTENHEYKISLTHNGKALEVDNNGLAYNSFEYGLDIFNSNSFCSSNFVSDRVQSSTYTFDSNSKINEKTLGDYEKEGYAFDVRVSADTRL